MRAVVGGVAGPAAFAATWWMVGRRRAGYSPVGEPISRLAAYRSPTRSAMTAGFAAYAAGVAAAGAGLRRSDPTLAAALAANAVTMVAVAALPLDAPYGDTPHVVAATAAYASLATLPLLGSGRRSVATGAVTAALLVLSQAVPSRRGLFQRLGLSIGHLWIMRRAVSEL